MFCVGGGALSALVAPRPLSLVPLRIRRRLHASPPAARADPTARQRELMARGLPKRRPIEGVAKVVLVASAKGGVGKSTTAVNLAVGLSRGGGEFGRRVGLLDADVYGPSIPTLMNLSDPPLIDQRTNKMIPLVNYGVDTMSIGYLVKQDAALVWRGPMLMSALEKLLHGTLWRDLDVLVVDMPPGTGDVHLSVVQTVEVAGAVIVSTPQKVALDDARKGMTMFEKVSVPVLGLVENMSGFRCASCGVTTAIFGDGGAEELARAAGVACLGRVPLDPMIMWTSDQGTPIVVARPESDAAKIYKDIADNIAQQLVLSVK